MEPNKYGKNSEKEIDDALVIFKKEISKKKKPVQYPMCVLIKTQ